jgi:hypothetical protein
MINEKYRVYILNRIPAAKHPELKGGNANAIKLMNKKITNHPCGKSLLWNAASKPLISPLLIDHLILGDWND